MTDVTVHADIKTLRAATRAIGPAVKNGARYTDRIHLAYADRRLTIEAGGVGAALSLAYTIDVDCKARAGWERTVSARSWRSAIKALPAGPVCLAPADQAIRLWITDPREVSRRVEESDEVTTSAWVTIDGKRDYKKTVHPVWAPQIDPAVDHTVETIDFDETHAAAFRRLIRSVDPDDMRPVLDTVYVTPTAARVTDSYTLSQIDGEYLPKRSDPVVIPGPLARLIPPTGPWSIEWWNGDGTRSWAVTTAGPLTASIDADSYTHVAPPLRDESYETLTSKVLAGEPIWEIERVVLTEVLPMIISDERDSFGYAPPTGVTVDDTKVTLTTHRPTEPPIAEAVIDGKPMDPAWDGIHFNASLLRNILTIHDDLILTFVAQHPADKLRPIGIVTPGRKSILMPVRAG